MTALKHDVAPARPPSVRPPWVTDEVLDRLHRLGCSATPSRRPGRPAAAAVAPYDGQVTAVDPDQHRRRRRPRRRERPGPAPARLGARARTPTAPR